MPDSPPRAAEPSRRRSPEQASGLANSLFRSFTAPAAPAPPPAADSREPSTGAETASALEVPSAADVESPAATGVQAPAAPERAPSGRPSAAPRPPARRGPTKESPDPAPAAVPARTDAQEGRGHRTRPSRPRLADPSAYATKHRNVQIARVQALLRSGDLDVLDEVAQRTLDLTGEDTNRSELLRALVEGLDAAGIADELAECGTHRQRVAFLAGRLRR